MTSRRSGRTSGAVLLLVLALLAGAVATPTQAGGVPPGQRDETGLDAPFQSVEVDDVRIFVDVRANGSARWRIEYWTRLDDENASRAFEDLRADVRANPSNYTARFESRIETTVDAASNATGREMTATAFGVSADTRSLPQEYGVVAYTFTWSGFARVAGDRVVVGDAIEGFFLDDRTRLALSWPDGYGVVEVRPEPDERRETAVVWRGSDTDFVSGEPSLVVSESAAGTDTDAGTDGTTDETPASSGDGGLLALLLVAVVAVAAGAGLAGWWLRRRRAEARPDGAAGDAGGAIDGRAGDGPTAGDDSAAGGEAVAHGGDDGPPEELLSNEERVLGLVEERGGRMKQQDVVEALGWTDAKTSQVVRDLRDEGKLEGFRLGRENVLALPDEDDS